MWKQVYTFLMNYFPFIQISPSYVKARWVKSQLILFEEESKLLEQACARLFEEAYAKVVFLIDKDGQLISGEGDTKSIDTTALASLTAGNIAATGGLAKLLGEKEFPVQFHEGERENIHISLIGERLILVVIFDERSSLGLVRLKVKKAHNEILDLFKQIDFKSNERGSSVFSEITDDDIDDLFSDT